MAGRCATSQPPETVPESGSELLELHGVDEGVDKGVIIQIFSLDFS